MSLRYLLDTNVLSEPLRPRPQAGVLAKIRQHQGELAMASVVWHELLYGAWRLPESAKRRAIEKYLGEVVGPTVEALPYDGRAARWHAAERARLTALGRTPPFVDGQIAAVAKVNGLIVVTMNVSDYQPFEDLEVEDWRT